MQGGHIKRKLHILLRYDIAEFYTELFSVFHKIIPKFLTIATIESFIKQNNDSHKTCMCVHDILL
jgi:hypothetical protein